MSNESYILVSSLCRHYAVEQSLLYSLRDHELLEITTIESDDYLHHEHLAHFERLMRINKDLHLDPESMDVVVGLLEKIENLQHKLAEVQSRLGIYE